MASIFGHGIVAYTITKVAGTNIPKTLIVLAIVSSIIPDLDVITFNFGIPYVHMFGHRGFSHSIFFAIIWALILTFSFGKTYKKQFFGVIFLSTLSHGILDAMTSGGLGVGFFIPFDNARFFFPFRGIKVSPIGIEKFFSEWGIQVISSELKYIFIPCVITLFSVILKRRNYT